jgi:DNA-binding XRE family transcriptional regulator
MRTRKFRELLAPTSANRRKKIAQRVRQTLATMPLDELRKARQTTQVKLAETLGINQSEVSRIEHRAGSRRKCKSDLQLRLAAPRRILLAGPEIHDGDPGSGETKFWHVLD